VGLSAPRIISRPSVFVVPPGFRVAPAQLEALRTGSWGALRAWEGVLPSARFMAPVPDPAWPLPLQDRFTRELARTANRLDKLDHRLHREAAAELLGGDPERLRQALFPLGRAQERILPGVPWLRSEALLDAILVGLDGTTPLLVLEER